MGWPLFYIYIYIYIYIYLYIYIYYLGLCKYTFAKRRNRLTMHFSKCMPVVKRRMAVLQRGKPLN